MILVDALFINDGGGKVLLDYLIQELNKSSLKVTYLLDQRLPAEKLNFKEGDIVLVMKASFFFSRRNFYKKNSAKYDKILCFGNLPPNQKTKAKVYTYFHQLLFLSVPETIKGYRRALYYLKINIVNLIKPNTDYWIVQSELTKKKLSDKFNLQSDTVLVLPFYPAISLDIIDETKIVANTFVYVSSGEKHKNHIRLIKAFCNFYDQYKVGELTLTVSENYLEETEMIRRAVIDGYPIRNIGFVKREELKSVYDSNEYLIFPSLTESFGLGIAEAIDQGCKVIGAELPYTYAVCVPSLTFDPFSIESIEAALYQAVFTSPGPSKNLVGNKINDLIKLLS